MSTSVPNPALISPVTAPAHPPAAAPQRIQPPQGPSFAQVLAGQSVSGPRFSKHAVERLQRRGIELDAVKLQRLDQGVQRAASKGSRDSVIFVDGTAFVVSVTSNTVVTAVGSEHMREQVFTNIDSAVIA